MNRIICTECAYNWDKYKRVIIQKADNFWDCEIVKCDHLKVSYCASGLSHEELLRNFARYVFSLFLADFPALFGPVCFIVSRFLDTCSWTCKQLGTFNCFLIINYTSWKLSYSVTSPRRFFRPNIMLTFVRRDHAFPFSFRNYVFKRTSPQAKSVKLNCGNNMFGKRASIALHLE